VPRRLLSLLSPLVLLALMLVAGGAQAQGGGTEADSVRMFVFWGEGCPHCDEQKPFLRELEQRYPDLEIREFEVFRTNAHHQLFIGLALAHGIEPGSVPSVFVGGKAYVGDGPQIRRDMEQTIRGEIAALRGTDSVIDPVYAGPDAHGIADRRNDNEIDIPLIGTVDLGVQPLVVTTLLIAFIDGLNPCSLWVLTLLLGLVIHSGSRGRVALVGITFLTTTALIYGAFIAGVFGVLSFVLYLTWVQWLVAAFALTFGLVNIKDYFWFRTGPSFTIADSHKPGIYKGMRKLLNPQLAGFGLFFATIVMASGIALVELPCTAGFPVIWSGIVADRGVTGMTFLMLLAIYLLIYLLIELVVFVAALVTLRMGKFQESQGRNLKLVGGMIMVALALVLVLDPNLMNDVGATLLLFVGAIGLALLVMGVHKRFTVRPAE
jgi:cytochrome c biogenesis protein CcdA/thiol-disulfide isomerase/thioredoxin